MHQKSSQIQAKGAADADKPCKYKQSTAATSPSTGNSNENDSIAKLELALAPVLNPDLRGCPLRTLPVSIMKQPP